MAPSKCIEARSYSRCGRLALTTALLLAVALSACASEEGRARRARRPGGGSAVDPPPERVTWTHFADLPGLVVVRPRMSSSHFVGEPTASIRTNAAAAAYGRAGALLPVGALLVVSHDLPEGNVHFSMERVAAGREPRVESAVPGREAGPASAPGAAPIARWEFAVIDASGVVVERGRLAGCVRCHEEAPLDEVFGPGPL